jgi:hypothetical protein
VRRGSELKGKGREGKRQRFRWSVRRTNSSLTYLLLQVVATNLRKYPAVHGQPFPGFCSGWQYFECLPLTFSFYSQEPSYLKATNDSTRRHDQAYPTSPQPCRQIHNFRSSKSLTFPLLHIRDLTFRLLQ